MRGVIHADERRFTMADDVTTEVVEEEQAQEQAVETTEASATSETPDTPSGEQATGGEQADAPAEATEATPKESELPKGVQKRLATMARQKNSARDDLAAANRRVAELEAEKTAAQNAPGPKPKMDDFDTEEEFYEAMAGHKANEIVSERMQADRAASDAQSVKADRDRIIDSHNVREEAYADTVDDYNDISSIGADFYRNNSGAVSAIIESEHGPEVMYHLGKNIEAAEKIGSMSPNMAAVAIGKIVARLEGGANTRNVSKAPAPIAPIDGSAETADSIDSGAPEKAGSYAAYEASRKAQEKAVGKWPPGR